MAFLISVFKDRRLSSGHMLLIAMLGFVMLSIGDSLVKSLAGDWPATAVGALRYSLATAGLALIVGLRQGLSVFKMPRPGLQFARGVAVAFATLGMFIGVQLIPLADATSIAFISPMITAAISALVLREPASRMVWLAIGLSFCGVLVILQPGLSFEPARLFPLITAFTMAILVILNRKVAGLASPLAMQFYVGLMALPILIPAAIAGHVSGLPAFRVDWPTWDVFLRVAIISCTATVGHLLIFLGTTRLSAAVVAPLTYVQLLVAGVIGWGWFGNAPTVATGVGAVFIIGGGLLLFRSQKQGEGQ